jgi:hypothetical protein
LSLQAVAADALVAQAKQITKLLVVQVAVLQAKQDWAPALHR